MSGLTSMSPPYIGFPSTAFTATASTSTFLDLITLASDSLPSGSQRPRDRVRSLLRDHDGGGVDIGRGDRRHHRGVGHAQAFDAANPQFGIDHGFVVAPHPASAARMIDRAGDPTDEAPDIVLLDNVRARPHLREDQRAIRLGRNDPATDMERGHRPAHVIVFGLA